MEKLIIGTMEALARGRLYHWLIGNDAHPAVVAFSRALLGGMIMGAIAFFAQWQLTDEPKPLITAGVQTFLTYVGVRFGVEGLVDTGKRYTPEGKE